MSSLSPARKQYLEFKKQFPDAILMYQVGDFYETFDEDAYITSRELQIVRTTRSYGKGKERVPLAGIPMHALENYVGKLVQRGYKVVICDQVSSDMKGRDVVERAVTRILTAGTLSEPNLLPARQNNYLVSIAASRTQTGLAAVDVSTGEFMLTWFAPEELPLALDAELQRLAPVECLLLEGGESSSYQFPTKNVTITYCPSHFFQQETAQTRLCRQFNVQALDAYGCANAPQAIAAAGAIVAYLEKMNGSLLSLLTGCYSYSTDSYMVLDAHTQRNLELLQGARSNSVQGSLLSVMDRTITPMGARQMRRTITQPLLDLHELNGRQSSVAEFYERPALRSRFTMCLQEFGDLERISGRIRQGTAVRSEVLGLRNYLQIIPLLRDLLGSCDAPMLLALADDLHPCPQVVELVNRALMNADEEDENGDDGRLIRAGYHKELDELFSSIRDSRRWMVSLEMRERERTGIKSLRVGFNKVFGYYIEVSNANLKLVPADYMRKQTLVNAERFITPELKEHEARILNAVERIEEMEHSIYTDVLRQIAVYYQELMTTAAVVAKVDVLLSFAEVATHQGYVRPVLEQGYRLEIEGGRHPVVEYVLDGDVFIPNDTHLEAEEQERIVLLTGPNMAGKSTYLRQVALIALLAHIGSFVPARSARIGLVDRIFTRVGAEDDIASGKSTFMIEMEETATILHHATRHSLIVLDEIGRGTSTYDGLAIARAVVEHLHNDVMARTLFATHYHELSAMADELAQLHVYTVAISEGEHGDIVFLHRVIPGSADRSYGIHVAKLAGMPPGVVRRADEVLCQLEMMKQAASTVSGEQHPYTDMVAAEQQMSRIADQAEQYLAEQREQFIWQSEEARAIAASVVQSQDETQESLLDTIDLYAITPLDALNILYLLKKKKSSNTRA
ncbi:MAG TPA: DNA mismatch repair protein MutS [Dictyobacter sp.]|jgi:DNA mismatch repair protein MutS|nr:DNA mismatch repair protein MutS [Dictyobacter sp.]